MSDYQTLLWEPHGAVLRLTCHRPQVLNAQSRVMIEELDAALARAAADDSVRVIIIAGAGKHFSAGHDLGTPEEIADRARRQRPEGFQHELQDLSALYLETCLRWHEIPKPTIAQVQGYCIMGGLMLASCCDLIVAADDAQFADRSVRWGGAHVQYLSMPWDLGPRKAKEYLFTGDYLGAHEAARLGLVNRVVPREALADATMALAAQIAEQDPYALKMAKASVNEMLEAQGHREALVGAFKNYMLTIPHRQALGTYGGASRTEGARRRIDLLNRRTGD